ncbi:MAG: ATP synthase subunit I [Candidatus Sulfotelmatobacter sp.]
MPASDNRAPTDRAPTNHGRTNHNLSPAVPQVDDFYSGAVGRIRGFMAGLALVLSAGAWWRFGRGSALGFALGCAIAYLNFHWLKRGVSGLADRVTNAGKSQSGKGIVARFLLRYVLLGAAAYVILTSFPASLRGLFAGLCLPVGAIACEAVYELYVALFRGV